MISASFYDRISWTQIIQVTQLRCPDFACFPLKRFQKSSCVNICLPGGGRICRTIFMYLDFNQKGQWKCDGGFMKSAASSEAYEDFLCDHVCWNVPQRCVGQSVVPGLQHLHRVKKDRVSPNPYRVTQQLQTIRTAQPHWSSSNLKAAADQRCVRVLSGWLGWTFVSRDHQHARTHKAVWSVVQIWPGWVFHHLLQYFRSLRSAAVRDAVS